MFTSVDKYLEISAPYRVFTLLGFIWMKALKQKYLQARQAHDSTKISGQWPTPLFISKYLNCNTLNEWRLAKRSNLEDTSCFTSFVLYDIGGHRPILIHANMAKFHMQQNGAPKWGCPELHPNRCNNEEFYLVGYKAEQSGESQLTFRKSISPSSSGSESKPSSCCLLHVGFSFRLPLDPEDGDGMFLRNVGWLSPDYTELYPIT
jgi:hypothetical protein